MAIRNFIACLLLALCWPVVAHGATSCEQRGLAVVEAARTYEHVREATGKNDGKEVEAILAHTGLPKGNPWCGAAVYTWYFDAGVGLPGGARAYAWAPTWHPAARVIWTKKRGIEPAKATPRPGDVFGLYYSHLKRVGHVGIIEVWGAEDDQTVITWEGNTNDFGSREGDGVYRKRRRKDQLYCVSRWAC